MAPLSNVNLKVQLTRLLSAVVLSVAACFFVVTYTRFSHFRFRFEHPGAQLMKGCVFIVHYSVVAYVIPIIALLAGIVALRARNSIVIFEVILAVTWVLSLGWAGLCLLLWQSQNVPMFSHMELHF